MRRVAQFSKDRKYRYSLLIQWGQGSLLNFIMLNPSTADEIKNDPTVERCERRARMWRFGGVIITNLFAWRSTNPAALYEVDNPVGIVNDAVIFESAIKCEGNIICAWGQHGKILNRGIAVAARLRCMGFQLTALKISSNNVPHHPLYLPYDLTPIEWNPSA